jgi:hypothetical protein
VSRGVVGVGRHLGQVLARTVHRVEGSAQRLMSRLGVLIGRAARVVAAGGGVAARPIRGAARLATRAARRVAGGVRDGASRAGAALEPVRALGRRARLASSELVTSTRVSARKLVSLVRHSLRSAVRRSGRRHPGVGDAVEASDGSGS